MSSSRARPSNAGAAAAVNTSRPSSRVKPGTNSSAAGSSSRPTSRTQQQQQQQREEEQARRQVVGQYMLGKTIGEGTFGKVKLAVHMPTGEKVAVKILEKSRIKESADVRRVNREIKILKKARHENVIQLYEVLDTQHAIYLIMECAEGGEMFDFIVASKKVPEVQACKFFHQIVEGVDMLHKNDITHRDLKPENLLLKASPDGWIVKVVDFGLSNTHEGNRLLSTACGSPCYAAPEMIAGKKYLGPLADIWSMGVILFALVCGFLPFEDANTSVLYKKILAGDYKTPKWLSPEVRDLLRRLLETDPRKRYTMNDIRRHVWYQLVSERDIPHEPRHDTPDDAFVRQETLSQLAQNGVDTAALLDGLASHACNSLTALFFLTEQKWRAKRAQQQMQQHAQPHTQMHAPQLTPLTPQQQQAVNGTQNISQAHAQTHTHSQGAAVANVSAPASANANAVSGAPETLSEKERRARAQAQAQVQAQSQSQARAQTQAVAPALTPQNAPTQQAVPSLDLYARTGLPAEPSHAQQAHSQQTSTQAQQSTPQVAATQPTVAPAAAVSNGRSKKPVSLVGIVNPNNNSNNNNISAVSNNGNISSNVSGNVSGNNGAGQKPNRPTVPPLLYSRPSAGAAAADGVLTSQTARAQHAQSAQQRSHANTNARALVPPLVSGGVSKNTAEGSVPAVVQSARAVLISDAQTAQTQPHAQAAQATQALSSVTAALQAVSLAERQKTSEEAVLSEYSALAAQRESVGTPQDTPTQQPVLTHQPSQSSQSSQHTQPSQGAPVPVRPAVPRPSSRTTGSNVVQPVGPTRTGSGGRRGRNLVAVPVPSGPGAGVGVSLPVSSGAATALAMLSATPVSASANPVSVPTGSAAGSASVTPRNARASSGGVGVGVSGTGSSSGRATPRTERDRDPKAEAARNKLAAQGTLSLAPR